MVAATHPTEIPRQTRHHHVVARELRTWLFAAIGSHPHIVATRAAPVEMTLAMPAKRSENQTVLAPALWALLANANLVFRAGESRFGHGNDGTIPSSTVAACTLIGDRRRGTTGEFPRILSSSHASRHASAAATSRASRSTPGTASSASCRRCLRMRGAARGPSQLRQRRTPAAGRAFQGTRKNVARRTFFGAGSIGARRRFGVNDAKKVTRQKHHFDCLFWAEVDCAMLAMRELRDSAGFAA